MMGQFILDEAIDSLFELAFYRFAV